ncbi:hypothetical protein Tco_0076976, partial [Tanacetum coccineum]
MEREREERQRQDQAFVDYIASLYDEVQDKMDTSEELASRLQIEERAAAVRNKPPTRTQLRSLMMTYLKHTGKYRHNQLNKKTFEEIQAIFIKEQERDADFIPIGSKRDEKMIDKMIKKAAGTDEEEVSESTKVEIKKEGHEENIRKRSGDDIRKNQEKWIIKRWTFYENCGVHILALEDGTEIHMLAERRYPLIRETLERMMELRLIAESK